MQRFAEQSVFSFQWHSNHPWTQTNAHRTSPSIIACSSHSFSLGSVCAEVGGKNIGAFEALRRAYDGTVGTSPGRRPIPSRPACNVLRQALYLPRRRLRPSSVCDSPPFLLRRKRNRRRKKRESHCLACSELSRGIFGERDVSSCLAQRCSRIPARPLDTTNAGSARVGP